MELHRQPKLLYWLSKLSQEYTHREQQDR
jgi:hypothetical protein